MFGDDAERRGCSQNLGRLMKAGQSRVFRADCACGWKKQSPGELWKILWLCDRVNVNKRIPIIYLLFFHS